MPIGSVPNFLINDCTVILLPPLAKLLNFSLLEGHVPDGFKSAIVTPSIKKPTLPRDDPRTTIWYPAMVSFFFVSFFLVSCLIVVAKQLLDNIHDHNLDNLHESAYKTGHSTETVLLHS